MHQKEGRKKTKPNTTKNKQQKATPTPPPPNQQSTASSQSPSGLASARVSPAPEKQRGTFVSSTYWPLLYRMGAGQSKKSDSTVFGFSSARTNHMSFITALFQWEAEVWTCSKVPFLLTAGGDWFSGVWNLHAGQAELGNKAAAFFQAAPWTQEPWAGSKWECEPTLHCWFCSGQLMFFQRDDFLESRPLLQSKNIIRGFLTSGR